jgi:hypothetical protein
VLGQSAGLANTDEDPCDLFGNPIALDPLGADLEGLVRTADGSFWMCDEYRPSLYRFNASGLMIERFVPVGANSYGAALGTEAFPAVYAQRRENRGFEAIAVWDDQLFCFIQSPLDNPDVANDANSKASRLVRIAKFNPVTRTVVAEYAYVLEGGASDKLGDACAFGPGRFLVVERARDRPLARALLANARTEARRAKRVTTVQHAWHALVFIKRNRAQRAGNNFVHLLWRQRDEVKVALARAANNRRHVG